MCNTVHTEKISSIRNKFKFRYLITSVYLRISSRLIDFLILGLTLIPLVVWEAVTRWCVNSNQSMVYSDLYFVHNCVTFTGVIIIITLELIIPLLTKGKTLGKLISKTRVISINGGNANFFQLLIKSLLHIIPFINNIFFSIKYAEIGICIIWIASYICMLITKHHQTLLEKLTGCCVVDDLYLRHIKRYLVNNSLKQNVFLYVN